MDDSWEILVHILDFSANVVGLIPTFICPTGVSDIRCESLGEGIIMKAHQRPEYSARANDEGLEEVPENMGSVNEVVAPPRAN